MLYTIQPTRVIYNTQTKEILKHFTGRRYELLFDSVGEFKCYLALSKLGLPIEVHKYAKHLDYKVDFTLHFLTAKSKLSPLLSGLGYRLHNNKYLYAEFKGVLDEPTVKRYASLPDILKDSFMIITEKPLAITYFDNYNNVIIKKPTVTVKDIRSLT